MRTIIPVMYEVLILNQEKSESVDAVILVTNIPNEHIDIEVEISLKLYSLADIAKGTIAMKFNAQIDLKHPSIVMINATLERFIMARSIMVFLAIRTIKPRNFLTDSKIYISLLLEAIDSSMANTPIPDISKTELAIA